MTPSYTEATYDELRLRDPLQARQYAGRCRGAFARAKREAPAWAVAAAPAKAEPALPLEPLVVPPELTAWRSRSSNRGFSVSIEGRVQLVDWQSGPVEARFATVAEALAAIAADAIRWRVTPRKAPERHSPSARNDA